MIHLILGDMQQNHAINTPLALIIAQAPLPADAACMGVPKFYRWLSCARPTPLATCVLLSPSHRLHASSCAHRSERYPLINRPVSEANMLASMSDRQAS